ncbi:GNAT family N-acetyltransferase [Leifsonia bigeumensis]|uniref:GNAT family N-acetyltransferase n=1 Tax=Leifsonella bigeumensis TaxID=433643 RepID=A0ABP7FCQ2_9MICO
MRRAGAADAAVLHEVAATTFPLACPPDSKSEDIEAFIAAHLTADAFARYLADPARTLLIAEFAGEPAGYAMLIAEEPHDPDVMAAVIRRPTVELSKFYVMPGQHGRGVAQVLMTATVGEAAHSGAASLWLGVNNQNERANRFYEKSGFVTVGTKRFRLGERWESDFVRELVLADS